MTFAVHRGGSSAQPGPPAAGVFRWREAAGDYGSAMKNFFSSFFATIAALLIFCIGGACLMFLVFAAFAAMGEKTVVVPRGAYLVLDLSANFQDKPDQMEGWDEFAEAFDGAGARNLQLRSVTRACRRRRRTPISPDYTCMATSCRWVTARVTRHCGNCMTRSSRSKPRGNRSRPT